MTTTESTIPTKKPKKKKSTKGPTIEQINKNKPTFADNMKKLASGEIKGKKSKLTIEDKLNFVKNDILLCKSGVKEKTISYAVIQHFLKKNLKIEVSETSLRKYCQEKLGFPKREKNNY